VLFGVEGLQVTGVEAGPGGGIEVWAVTDYEAARAWTDARAHATRSVILLLPPSCCLRRSA
jgi:hypothetical protein